MRIRRVELTAFGGRSGLVVAGLNPGLNLIYGPNEAGKTTLLEAVRGAFFGFLDGRSQRNRYLITGGRRVRLELVDANEELLLLERCDGRHGLSLQRADGSSLTAGHLAASLCHVDRNLYENLFAFSLTELSSLHSLSASELQDRLLGAAFGTGDQSPAQALQEISARKNKIYQPRGRRGQVAGLRRLLEDIGRRRQQLAGRPREYDELVAGLAEKLEQRRQLREKKQQLEKNISRQVRLLARREDWDCLRAASAEIAGLPHLQALPARAQLSFEGMLAELSRAEEQERQCLHELDRLEGQHGQNGATTVKHLPPEAAPVSEAAILAGKARFFRRLVLLFGSLGLIAGAGLWLAGAVEKAGWLLGGTAIFGVFLGLLARQLSVSAKTVCRRQQKNQLDLARGEHEKLRRQTAAVRVSLERFLESVGAVDESQFRAWLNDLSHLEELRRLSREKEAILMAVLEINDRDQLGSRLLRLDWDQEALRLDEMKRRQAALATELSALEENIGAARERCREWENQAELAELRQQEATALSQLENRMLDFLELEVADWLLAKARNRYEKEKQSEVLRRASEYFSLLTGGRWQGVGIRFGANEISAVRADGRVEALGLLSRGTVEPLYLALRLALVEDFAREVHGAPPVIMDDILVNFDEERSAHAIRALLEAGRRSQIIMLSCHRRSLESFRRLEPEVGVYELDSP